MDHHCKVWLSKCDETTTQSGSIWMEKMSVCQEKRYSKILSNSSESVDRLVPNGMLNPMTTRSFKLLDDNKRILLECRMQICRPYCMWSLAFNSHLFHFDFNCLSFIAYGVKLQGKNKGSYKAYQTWQCWKIHIGWILQNLLLQSPLPERRQRKS